MEPVIFSSDHWIFEAIRVIHAHVTFKTLHAKKTEKTKSLSPHARWTMLSLCGHDVSRLAILCPDRPFSRAHTSAMVRWICSPGMRFPDRSALRGKAPTSAPSTGPLMRGLGYPHIRGIR